MTTIITIYIFKDCKNIVSCWAIIEWLGGGWCKLMGELQKDDDDDDEREKREDNAKMAKAKAK